MALSLSSDWGHVFLLLGFSWTTVEGILYQIHSLSLREFTHCISLLPGEKKSLLLKNIRTKGFQHLKTSYIISMKHQVLSYCSESCQHIFGYSKPRKLSAIRVHYVGSERWRWMMTNQELMRIEEIQLISPGDLCGHPSFPPSAPNLDLCPARQKTNQSILEVHSGEIALHSATVQSCRRKHFFSG